MKAMISLILLMLFLFLDTNIGADTVLWSDILKRTLPAYSLAAASSNGTDESVSTCREQLTIFRRAVDDRNFWALKILDASGEPKPGFTYGNNYWLGIRSQCLDAGNEKPLALQKDFLENSSRLRDGSEEFPPFEVKYFVARFRSNSTMQFHVRLPNEDLITLGLCLPASCSTREIGMMLLDVFREKSLIFGELYSANFQLEHVTDLIDDHEWIFTKRFFIFSFIVLSIIMLTIIGTIYDVSQNTRGYVVIKDPEVGDKNNEIIKLNNNNNNCEVVTMKKKSGSFGNFLLCFSIYSNTKLIFSTKLSCESIRPIHGLRFLGMIWIIMIHTVFYMSDYVDNKVYSWKMSNGFFIQIISNSTFSVDTFFFISGFLLSYLYFNAHKNIGRKSNSRHWIVDFFLTVLRRFIRLTPTYVMMMNFVQLSSSWYGNTSQFYMTERPQETCEKYWWRNILYINNFFGRENMCMSWSWYLSNDMQFFIIGNLLLILSSIWLSVAIAILLILLFGSIIVTGYIAYINNYTTTMDVQLHMLDLLYDPPWTRIGPYIIGILTAFIFKRLNKKLTVQKRIIVFGWLFGGACNFIVLFGLYERQLPILLSSVYVALSRVIWTIGIAWLLIACCTNHGGFVNKILCFKAWIPLSRLTYCAYLLNPFLINLIYLHSESPLHMDFFPNFTMFLGNLVVTYCCSFLLSLMIETPIVLIMRTFISVKKYVS